MSPKADHGEDRFEAFEYDSRFFVNPGSATGAFSPLWTPPQAPSTKSADSTSPAGATQESDQAKPEDASLDPLSAKLTPLATSSYPPTPTPSFALLDIQGTVVVRLPSRKKTQPPNFAYCLVGGLRICISRGGSTGRKSGAPGERKLNTVRFVRGRISVRDFSIVFRRNVHSYLILSNLH